MKATIIKIEQAKQKRLVLLIFFVMVSIGSILPFAVSMVWGADDLQFHLNRIASLSNVFSSPVNLEHYQYGNLVNAMYPWITIYPAYIIYAIVGNIKITYLVFIFFVNLITLYIAYYTFNKVYNKIEWSVFFALTYTFATYRLLDLYIRAAIGEVLGISFLPLLFLGLWYIFATDIKKWYVFSIAIALLAYSHVITFYFAIIACVIAIIICFIFVDEKLRRFFALFKAGVLSLLFISPIIISIGSEILQNKQLMLPVSGENYLGKDGAISLVSLLGHSIGNYIFSGYCLGTMLFILCILVIVRFKYLSKMQAILFLSGIVCFLATSNLVPWTTLFRYKIVNLIQFPSRLLIIPTLLIAFVGVRILWTYKARTARLIFCGLIILSVCTVGLSSYFYISHDLKSIMSDKEMSERLQKRNERLGGIENGSEELGTVFYDYATKDIGRIMEAEHAKGEIWQRSWTSKFGAYRLDGKEFSPVKVKRTENNLIATVNLKNDSNVQIPLSFNDEAFVKIDGKKTPIKSGKYGMMEVQVEKGMHTIIAGYRWQLFTIISFYLAAFTWLSLLISRIIIAKKS
jgi:hypothetical protein